MMEEREMKFIIFGKKKEIVFWFCLNSFECVHDGSLLILAMSLSRELR